MKKIILFVLFISCLFIKPIMEVSADVAVPVITSYSAIVTNPKGAKAYEDSYEFIDEETMKPKLVIPYNAEVLVVSEFEGVDARVKYNNVQYIVSADDITPKSGEYELKNAVHYDSPKKAMTVTDIYIYSGPSKTFKKVGTISKNVELSFEYVIEDTYGYASWVYVSYEGKEGWTQYGHGWATYLALVPEDGAITILKNYKLGSVTINSGTKLDCLYTYAERSGDVCFISYNGTKGWIYSWDEEDDDNNFFKFDNEPVEPEPLPDEPSEPTENNTTLYLCIGAAVIVALTAYL